MSFFSIFKTTKLEKYLKNHGNDRGMDILFQDRGMEGVLAYLFILYAHNAVTKDKDFRKMFNGASPEVLMFETAFFDFFTIAYLIDCKDSNEQKQISVIGHKLFIKLLSEISVIFESLCGFDRSLGEKRLNIYLIDGFPLNLEQIKATYNLLLENCWDAKYPVEKPDRKHMLRFGNPIAMLSSFLFHAEIRHTTMHKPLHDSIFGILEHFKKTHLLYEKHEKIP